MGLEVPGIVGTELPSGLCFPSPGCASLLSAALGWTQLFPAVVSASFLPGPRVHVVPHGCSWGIPSLSPSSFLPGPAPCPLPAPLAP